MLEGLYLVYAIISLICFVAMLYFHTIIKKHSERMKGLKHMLLALCFGTVTAVMDIVYAFRAGGVIQSEIVNHISETIYAVGCLMSTYCWFIASEMEQRSVFVKNKLCHTLVSLPYIVMLVLTLSNFMHKSIYHFEGGHYVRGHWGVFFSVTMLAYIAKTSCSGLWRSFMKEHYLSRKLYRIFFYYGLLLMIAELLQLALGPVLPFRSLGTAFTFFIMQERILISQVYVDALSGCNNRAAMENYLRNKFPKGGGNFYFALMDIDSFKLINDKYGHDKGDQAIQATALALKMSSNENFFLARFGGDEFVLIGEAESPEELMLILEKAKKHLLSIYHEIGMEIPLSFSYGISHKTEKTQTIPDLIKRADDLMYEWKKIRKEA